MKKIVKIIKFLFLTGIASIICMPIFLILMASIKSNNELVESFGAVIGYGESYASFSLFPEFPTGKHYWKLLLFTPQFFVVFWNSVKLVVIILLGQMLIAVPVAWAFAGYRFRYRKILFSLYIILMLMPFQVTMLSNYFVLHKLHLLDTHGAIILPAIFATFSVFLIYRGFCAIPKDMIEAAKIDGAGDFAIFIKIAIPIGSGGILSAFVLNFLEYWNLMEQPLTFLKDKSLWPISLYLPEIGVEQIGTSFAASIIILILPILVFVIGQDYLEQGIISSAMKE